MTGTSPIATIFLHLHLYLIVILPDLCRYLSDLNIFLRLLCYLSVSIVGERLNILALYSISMVSHVDCHNQTRTHSPTSDWFGDLGPYQALPCLENETGTFRRNNGSNLVMSIHATEETSRMHALRSLRS